MSTARSRWPDRSCPRCGQARRRDEFDRLPDGERNGNCRHCVSRSVTTLLRKADRRAQADTIRRAPRQRSMTASERP